MSLQTESRRLYFACLASYNAGKLYGAWVDADQDADDMRAEVAEMLRGSPCPNTTTDCPECDGAEGGCEHCDHTGKVPTAEEWAVHDYEGFGPIKLGEHPDLDTVAEVAEALDDHGEAYAVWYANESRDGADVDGFEEDYQGTFTSLEDWAESWLEDTGALKEVPSSLRSYIDFASWARDAEMGGDIWSEDGSEGTHVFTNR